MQIFCNFFCNPILQVFSTFFWLWYCPWDGQTGRSDTIIDQTTPQLNCIFNANILQFFCNPILQEIRLTMQMTLSSRLNYGWRLLIQGWSHMTDDYGFNPEVTCQMSMGSRLKSHDRWLWVQGWSHMPDVYGFKAEVTWQIYSYGRWLWVQGCSHIIKATGFKGGRWFWVQGWSHMADDYGFKAEVIWQMSLGSRLKSPVWCLWVQGWSHMANDYWFKAEVTRQMTTCSRLKSYHKSHWVQGWQITLDSRVKLHGRWHKSHWVHGWSHMPDVYGLKAEVTWQMTIYS